MLETQPMNVDPVLASVLARRYDAITKEMATLLMRSSRSPIFNEVGDLVTVIFDAEGRTLAQAEFAAIIAFGAQPPLKYIIEYFGDDIHEGDVIIHNDVFTGGNQNADTGIYMPIFHEGTLVAWTAAKGHLADIGGMTAGGYDPRAREVWQEAFRIPPLKVTDRGVPRKDVWDLIAANIRFSFVIEDIKAMVGACEVGRRQLAQIYSRHGYETISSHMQYVLEASDKQVRAELSTWPNGVYYGESEMVSDGVDPTSRHWIRVKITVDDDSVTFDFTDSDDQTPGIANQPKASASGAVRISFLMLVAAGGVVLPTNEGLFGPIKTVFREGSLLNPTFPAATIYGNQMTDNITEAIMNALADALPERVTAGWCKAMNAMLSGTDPVTGEPYVSLTVFQRNGPGAMKGHDGWDAFGFSGVAGQMRSPDVEMFELTSPHFFEFHEYDSDSAGAGQWRGGLGTRSAWRIEGINAHGVTLGEGMASEGATPGRGLLGGEDSGLNVMELHLPNGENLEWGSKEYIGTPTGSMVLSLCGGGAGYGDPYLRPVANVLQEVLDEITSIEKARESYGVVINPESLTVDEEETANLRGQK